MISPNFDERPAPPDMIVLHYTEIDEAASRSWLCNPASRVSCHYLLREDGGWEVLVPEDKRAWHAGVSGWEGVGQINSRSIGIEIVNAGHRPAPTPFPRVQIDSVIALVADIRSRWRIHRAQVVGHSDIAPGRKIDPGEAFPWDALAAAGEAIHVPPATTDAPFNEADFRDAARTAGYWTDPIDGKQPELSALIDATQRRHTPAQVGSAPTGALTETLKLFAHARAAALLEPL
mgnify:CR=1 FL=1